jgi:hypothetical protein
MRTFTKGVYPVTNNESSHSTKTEKTVIPNTFEILCVSIVSKKLFRTLVLGRGHRAVQYMAVVL